MQLTKEKRGECSILSVHGRLDGTTSPKFETEVLGWLSGGGKSFVLDMGGISFMSSAALRVLLSMAKRVGRSGGKVVLASPNAVVSEVFEISNFSAMFTICQTLDEGVVAATSGLGASAPAPAAEPAPKAAAPAPIPVPPAPAPKPAAAAPPPAAAPRPSAPAPAAPAPTPVPPAAAPKSAPVTPAPAPPQAPAPAPAAAVPAPVTPPPQPAASPVVAAPAAPVVPPTPPPVAAPAPVPQAPPTPPARAIPPSIPKAEVQPAPVEPPPQKPPAVSATPPPVSPSPVAVTPPAAPPVPAPASTPVPPAPRVKPPRKAGPTKLEVVVGSHIIECRDGDVIGLEGTVAPHLFKGASSLQPRHVLIGKGPEAWFVMVPRNVQVETHLDNVVLTPGVRQNLSGEHCLKVAEFAVSLRLAEGHAPSINDSFFNRLMKILHLG